MICPTVVTMVAKVICALFILSVAASKGFADGFKCPDSTGSSLAPPLYAHEDKCYLYYDCLNTQPFLLACTYPLLYNPVTSVCELRVDCGSRQPWSNEPVAEDFVCPAPDGVFPNEEFCWKYWLCGGGVAYPMDCPQDYHYDIGHEYCDFPDRVDCGDRKPRPGQGTTESGGNTGGEVTQGTGGGGPTTTRPSGGEFQCPAEEGLFPNPNDCESYYTCANFNWWLVSCPPDEQFDPDTDSCDFTFNVNCKETSSGLIYITAAPPTGDPRPTPDPSFVCPSPSGLFPYPQDCHYFYKCEGGQATLSWCGERMYFNAKGGYCDEGDCTFRKS